MREPTRTLRHSGSSARSTNATPRTTGTVEPYQGEDPGDLMPHVPNAITYNRADWTSLRVPASSRPQEVWGKAVTPVRAALLACLWLSYTWWRVAIFWLLLGTIVALLWIAVGA